MRRRIDVAIEAVKAAGAVIRSGHYADLDIQEKGSSRTSIVTATDLRSQQEIVRVIRQAYRDDLIVGEEGTEGDDGAELRWYIDPLDGTSNYLEEHMSPWDTLAGTLLIEEAGGRVTTFAGASRPIDGTADILATNGQLHDDIVARLALHGWNIKRCVTSGGG